MSEYFIYEGGATVYEIKDGNTLIEHSKSSGAKTKSEEDLKEIQKDIEEGAVRRVSSVDHGFHVLNQIDFIDSFF